MARRSNPLSLGRDLAIDLGTANTLIYVAARASSSTSPSVVAINVNDGKPVAVGLEAKRMMGRTPNHIRAIRPLKDGVIADFEVCEKMLRYFIQRVHASKWNKPRWSSACRRASPASSSAPCRTPPSTPAPASRCHIIEEPMAAAIGADLPGPRAVGNMVVDIGGGTTEVAVISLGGIVTAQSVRVAGDELDDAVLQYVKKEFSLAIGDRTAEEIKIQMGSAWPMEEELTADIRGRDLISGLPRTDPASRPSTSASARRARSRPIVDAVKTTLDKTPARAGRRHHGGRHHHHRRWAPAGRPRRAPGPRDRHADPGRRRAALQRRHRLRPRPREHRRDARADVARWRLIDVS
jgi:rod shape-determining protein MreB